MTIRRIHVLDPQLANKIAAGEVVERPASVVKELVENSLDAGATAVTVEINEGGAEYIRVTDNGCGIPNEDAEKAFLRHATSKLSSAEGLDGIETLGFRGEALASIAAVSHVTMRTRTEDEEHGTIISIDGGEVKEAAPCGCPTGTNIEVRELFYNVPARLKFLKSPRAEAAAVGDYMLRLILANTGVSFKFINNGKPVYHSAGDGSLENALICVYGSDIAEHIKPVEYDDGYMRITGYCGDEESSKANRIHQSIFINGRYIRSQQISFAAQRAYTTRLMAGRFPFLALNIRLSPREVDVNVHPNKLTVRFRDEDRVSSAVMLAVRDALEGNTLLEHKPIEKQAPRENAQDIYSVFRRTDEKPADIDITPLIKQESAEQKTEEPKASAPSADPAPVMLHDSASAGAAAEEIDVNGVLHYSFAPDKKPEPIVSEPIAFGVDPYTVIGAIFDTYIVVEQGDQVFFIDQHAAHERILYEKLIKNELRFDSQLLLTSEIVNLTPAEFACVMENKERFCELGFDIEEFGPLSVSVHAVPAGVRKESIERLMRDMTDILMRQGSVTELDIVRGSLIQASCKHAIKGGRALNPVEIEEILSHYSDGSTPLTCPHGRPVMIRRTKRDLEKIFKRIV